MKISKMLQRGPALIVGVLLGLAMLSGCEKEGPAERAGEHMDEAMEESATTIEEGIEDAGEQLEEAGDAIEDKTQ